MLRPCACKHVHHPISNSFNILIICKNNRYIFQASVMVMVFNPTFKLYRGGQIYWCRKQEYPEKTIDLPQVTEKLHCTMLYRIHLAMIRILSHNVSGDIDCLHWKLKTSMRSRPRQMTNVN